MEAARERESVDRGLLVATIFLLILGCVIVLDASYVRAMNTRAFGYDPYYFFKRQAMWAGLSLVALAIASRFPYWRLRRFWMIGIAVSVVLLIAVMIPGIGREVNGARRWLGFGPMTFQPSEMAKLALVVFLARYSELWRSRVRHFWKGFAPAVAMVVLIGVLVAKEDLGTAIVTVCTGLLMIVMMGARLQHLFVVFGMAIGGGVLAILVEPFRMERIWAWLTLLTRPYEIHDGVAYQPTQGLIALGSGGIYGHGIMRGSAKHLYLPAEHTDYIFATVGEEAGLLGCLVLLGLFTWLVIRGLTVAHRTRDWFGSLLAAGLVSIVGCQALLNIAVVSGIVPCTGVPLPFISYGGSSLLFITAAIGVVLNISRHPNQVLLEPRKRQPRESRADGWRHGRPHLSGT
jgi:cell division protein FtsW